MKEVFGMPVVELQKERYRYRPRTDECFHFQFAFLVGSVDIRTGQVIPDPQFPGVKTMQVWSKV